MVAKVGLRTPLGRENSPQCASVVVDLETHILFSNIQTWVAAVMNSVVHGLCLATKFRDRVRGHPGTESRPHLGSIVSSCLSCGRARCPS